MTGGIATPHEQGTLIRAATREASPGELVITLRRG